MSSPSPGLIRVTGNFVNSSSATSVLIVIYSTDNCNDVYYTISSLSTEGETLVTNISSLVSGPYNVSVFVLEENGLPFIRSASTPRSVLVEEYQGDENGEQFIIADQGEGGGIGGWWMNGQLILIDLLWPIIMDNPQHVL